MTKEQFKKQFNLTEDQYLGIEVIEGNLDLRSVTTLPEGISLTTGGNLYLDSVTTLPEGISLTTGGNLYLSSVTTLPEGISLTTGRNLYLNSLTTLPEGISLTVGGHLDLSSVTTLPKGISLTVGGSLNLRSVTTLPEGISLTVGGYLDLNSVTTLPEGLSLTVGNNLYLDSVTTLPEGISLTVGDGLYLNSITTLPEGLSLTVGGSLYLDSKLKKDLKNYTKLDLTKPITFQNGKYIKIDGIFTEVVNKKGNVYKVKKLNQTKEFYIVTDGNGKFSHGDTLKEAKEDLIYKISSNLDKSKYKNLTLQSKLTFEEGIEAYRVITGACSFGVKDFVTTNKVKKTSYTVEEIIKLTSNSYGGSTFKEFFK